MTTLPVAGEVSLLSSRPFFREGFDLRSDASPVSSGDWEAFGRFALLDCATTLPL